MPNHRGAYTRRKTKKLTREQIRAFELTGSKTLGRKISISARQFFESRGIENSGQALRPAWDTETLEHPVKRFVRYKSEPMPQRVGPAESLTYGTARFALRVEEELRIAKASGIVKIPSGECGAGPTEADDSSSCSAYPH